MELSNSIKMIFENKIEKDDEIGENFQIECPFSKDFTIILSQKIPSEGQKISKLVKEQILNEQTLPSFAKTIAQMEAAEKEFFEDKKNALFNWNENTIIKQFEKNGQLMLLILRSAAIGTYRAFIFPETALTTVHSISSVSLAFSSSIRHKN